MELWHDYEYYIHIQHRKSLKNGYIVRIDELQFVKRKNMFGKSKDKKEIHSNFFFFFYHKEVSLNGDYKGCIIPPVISGSWLVHQVSMSLVSLSWFPESQSL